MPRGENTLPFVAHPHLVQVATIALLQNSQVMQICNLCSATSLCSLLGLIAVAHACTISWILFINK
jgi:hypothetical protein